MPEHRLALCLLSAACLVSVAGMAWLALSMQVHARQAWGDVPTAMTARLLRWMGASSLAVALGLCLSVDHASMAVLVWIMVLVAASLLVTFTLAWRPWWLRVFAPWVRAAPDNVGHGHGGDRQDH